MNIPEIPTDILQAVREACENVTSEQVEAWERQKAELRRLERQLFRAQIMQIPVLSPRVHISGVITYVD